MMHEAVLHVENAEEPGPDKVGGNGGNCPGAYAPKGSPVMTFVLNKIFL